MFRMLAEMRWHWQIRPCVKCQATRRLTSGVGREWLRSCLFCSWKKLWKKISFTAFKKCTSLKHLKMRVASRSLFTAGSTVPGHSG